MKKFFTAAVAALFCATSLWAEVKTPYTETFDDPVVRPKGWNKSVDPSYGSGTYTHIATGGHSGGYLKVDQSSNYAYSGSYYYKDLLVSPKVSGDIKLWVRKDGSSPTLTVYDLGDGTATPALLAGTSNNILEGVTVDGWTQISIANLSTAKALGIRAHNLDIDDFTATQAEVLYRVGLTASIKDKTETVAYGRVPQDADGNITVKFDITITNVGDVDIPLVGDGFKIEVINTSADNAVFGTDKITEAIPYAGTFTKSFTMTAKPVIVGQYTNGYSVRISHQNLAEPVTGSIGSYIVVPYTASLEFMLLEANDKNFSYTGENYWNAFDPITIGQGAAGTSRTMWVWNSGLAPLEVSSTTVSDGFECDVDAFTLASKEKKAVTVKLTGDAGYRSGKITFAAKGLGDVAYDLNGAIIPEGKYAENFEGEGSPAGWVLNSWTIKTNDPAGLATLGTSKWANSPYSTGKMFSPKLTFAEGENLYFMTAKTDNYDGNLKVYTSPDRVNWTEVCSIVARAANEGDIVFNNNRTTGGFGTWDFQTYAVAMPAGDCYVAFEAGKARIDNVSGGTLVPLSHDLYVNELNLPETASVNTRYITAVTVSNLALTDETDYEIALEVNGQIVARAEDAPVMKHDEKYSFTTRYTPHTEGPVPARILFIKGDDTVALASFDIEVGPEKVESVYQVGTEKINADYPLRNNYGGCQTQVIYTSDILGMDAGSKLLGFYLTGYNNNDITKHIRVWVQNTDDEAYDPDNIQAEPKENMTLVFDGDYHFPVAGSYANDIFEPYFKVDFSQPFEYTGANLRVMFEQTSGEDDEDNKKSTYFRIDNSRYDYWNDKYDYRLINNPQDYADDLDDEAHWYLYKTGIPVAYFTVAKDVVVVKGNVTDDFGAPVEGASLSLTSDDILYSASTDANGAYSMNVANVNLVYILTTEAEGFDTDTVDDVAFNAKEEPVAVHDVVLAWTDRSATLSGHVYDANVNHLQGAPGVEITLTSGNTSVSATTDEDGAYTVTVPDFSVPYAVTVTQNGELRYTNIHNFESKADTADYSIDYAGITTVTENIADADAEYFNLQGVRIKNPRSGQIYLKRQGGKTVKAIIR